MTKMFCLEWFDGEIYRQEYFLCVIRAAMRLEHLQRTDRFAAISTLDLDTGERSDPIV